MGGERKEGGGRRIGLYGGSFDPIHMAHLLLAEQAYDRLSLDEVRFIPAYEPPHKKGKEGNAADRLVMLELALEGNPHFQLDRREYEAGGVCYSYDTVKSFLEERPSDRFFFIMGEDSLLAIDSWYRGLDLITMVEVIVGRRPGSGKGLDEKVRRLAPSAKGIYLLDDFMMDCSSKKIRDNLSQGRSVRYLLPARVEDYIRKKGLYGSRE